MKSTISRRLYLFEFFACGFELSDSSCFFRSPLEVVNFGLHVLYPAIHYMFQLLRMVHGIVAQLAQSGLFLLQHLSNNKNLFVGFSGGLSPDNTDGRVLIGLHSNALQRAVCADEGNSFRSSDGLVTTWFMSKTWVLDDFLASFGTMPSCNWSDGALMLRTKTNRILEIEPHLLH